MYKKNIILVSHLLISAVLAFPENTNAQTYHAAFASDSSDNQLFYSPPNDYRIVKYTLNMDLEQESVDQLMDYGFGGIQACVPYENYLQDENGWMQTIGDVDLAHNNGMKVWIHDERGYPSGAAGGLVVEGHPELESRGLLRITRKGKGPVAVTMELPPGREYIRASLCPVVNGEPDFENAAEIPITGNMIDTRGLDGEWQLSVFGIVVLDKDTHADEAGRRFGQTGHYPNLLNRDACARFIELTHQAYADRLDSIGEKVEAFVVNEPSLMTTWFKPDASEGEFAFVAWEKGLPDEFMSMHGYDLIPCLDALFGGSSTGSKMIRLHFQQTVGEILTRNFTGQITEWCHRNGVNSCGHFLGEEHMICHVIFYGDYMKVMRKMEIPACDIPIARPGKTGWNFWMPKYVSSASYLENRYGMVNALIDPIIGYGRDDMSPDIPYQKRTLNMAFLCGINQVNTYIPHLQYTGEEKDQHVLFGDYVARICLMLRGAKNEAPVAMYYPIETYQASYIPSTLHIWKTVPSYLPLQKTQNRLAGEILQSGLDFNYVTADAIRNATVIEGKMKVGEQYYASIVMPRVEVIPLDVLKKLRSISGAGIPVHWVDAVPSLGTANSDHEEVREIASALSAENDPLPDLKSIRDKEFNIRITSSDSVLYMARFTREGYMIYYVINDADHEITVTAGSEKIDTVQLYDPDSGTIRVATLPISEMLGGNESLFLTTGQCIPWNPGPDRPHRRDGREIEHPK